MLSTGRDLGSTIGHSLWMGKDWPKVRIHRVLWAGECLNFWVNVPGRTNTGKLGTRKFG